MIEKCILQAALECPRFEKIRILSVLRNKKAKDIASAMVFKYKVFAFL